MPLHEFRATVEKQSLAIVGSGPTGTEGANALDVADYLATPLRSDTIVGDGHAATARFTTSVSGARSHLSLSTAGLYPSRSLSRSSSAMRRGPLPGQISESLGTSSWQTVEAFSSTRSSTFR